MTTLVQVRGTIRAPDNTPAPDLVVTFRLSGPLLDAASNLLVEPVTVRADVSPLGVFAVSLAANDDPALQPAGSTYLVSVSARGTSESRHIIVPIAGAALGVELADIATAISGPSGFVYALSSTVTALDARVVVLEVGGGAAGAVETHRADTTVVHGIVDTAALVLTSDARLTGNQPLDSDLTTIAALDSAVAGVLASEGAGWLRRTYAQVKTSLGLVKADVGLGLVDNTSDVAKPVSTAQAAANALLVPLTQKAVASGVATLDGATKIPLVQLPGEYSYGSGQYLAIRNVGGIAGSSQGINFMRATAVDIVTSVVLNAIGVNVTVGVASATCRVGIYSDVGGFPGALILDAGTVDCSTSGIKEVTISQTLARGRYWLVGCSQGAAATVSTASGCVPPVNMSVILPTGATAVNGYYNSAGGISGAFPNPFGFSIANVPSGLIRVHVKVA